ncbi:pilus assembly protein TadG-related protein [Microbacterium oleivorans]|uniref:pilus assembly protein TadG-related protein n=1 Tax=Microbacterium oleivorans TaxID=273677 RepID=UPI00080E3194|nr:pilus assembly protein TadG-related protein [Microbacterium oleivorans]
MSRGDEDGSVLLLTIGYALLALVLVFVTVDATSLYLAQKRTQATADAAALAGADGFTLEVVEGEPRAELTDGGVREQARAITAAEPGANLVAAATPDGVSARVVVSSVWHPPISTLFVPGGVTLQATATSRTALE